MHGLGATTTRRRLELLAPAGDHACLEAALEAGADAVYLGLTALNARKRARNFSEDELARAVELAHGRGKRIYLTLNIDLAQDELLTAARMLEIASRRGVDAIIARDAALLALRPHYPELEYHLSTQACIASSADVEAAGALGVRRVVLARELTLAEVAAASAVPGVETEVFVHGALCFAVSGRCLLSSWVGGKSGNRGQCTSPCRVPWSADGRPAGTPFSMHDLSLIAHLDELRAAGVHTLKIEGRMKNPSWVRSTVGLLRRAVDGDGTPDELLREAARRGATPGRRLTSAFLDGRRSELVEPSVPEADHDGEPTTPAAPPAPVRDSVTALLRTLEARPGSALAAGADRVRLHASAAAPFLAQVQPTAGAIVEGLAPGELTRLRADHPAVPLVAALPSVFFEDERPALTELVAACVALGVTVEVNTWGGWQLARAAGAAMIGGPGLGVLNALAARELAARGLAEVTASIEIDALKLEALIAASPVPCAVVVYARPALMTTRVDLPPSLVAAELADRRGARLRAHADRGLWELRPVVGFDLRRARLPAGIAHTVVDLVTAADPLAEWSHGVPHTSRFNFDRALS